MQAVILAGGKGTRLRPYTTIFPKPLLPINGYPVLEILIKQLKIYGINEIFLSVGYLSHLLESYFGNGERIGVKIIYSREEKPLGTVGPLSLLKKKLDQNFLVLNGDILTNMNFGELFEKHINSDCPVTICTYKKHIQVDLGVLKIADNRLLMYEEKPEMDYYASMGLYVLNKKIIYDHVKQGDYMDFPNLINLLIDREIPINIYQHKGIWLDMGTPKDYEKAVENFHNLKLPI